MATTVLRQPTTPNATQTNLLYTVSSSLATEPQFRYVADIYENGSSDLLTRIKTSPNAYGVTIFDLGKIYNDYLDYDLTWQITESVAPTNSVKTFNVKFGEEYASSISGSPVIYTGSTDNFLTVFPAVVEPDAGSYDFPKASYTNENNPLLSNNPYTIGNPKPIGGNDYETISLLNANPAYINSISVVVDSTTYTLSSATWSNAIVSIPAGPQNFIDLGGSVGTDFSNGFTSYYIDVDFSSGTDNLRYYFIYDEGCHYEPTRFAFINKFGMWDYYSVNLPDQRSTNINRDNYISSFVNYSTYNSNYDINRRGITQYNSTVVDRFNITTDWLDTSTANWLSELFESPSVYKQTSNGFVPINITTADYAWKTNPRGQKVFQYNIEYTYSNSRRSRS